MDEEEIEAVARVCRSKNLFRYSGYGLRGEVNAFEQELRRFLGLEHVLAVTSGTAALHAALFALGVGPGMEVIVPAYLWVSVVAAVVNLGAIPVLADIDSTFCMNPESLERAITPRTAGVIVVHMNGAPADIDALCAVARRHNLFVLEDCAQCVGGAVHGTRVGNFGDMAIFSFQANKNMSSGEGGAVVTNSLELYQRALAYHDNGYVRARNGELLTHEPAFCTWGHGERLDELRAAVLRVQLRKLPSTIHRMRQSKHTIIQAIGAHEDIAFRRVPDPAGDTGCFLLTTFPNPEIAHTVNATLRELGICAQSKETSNVLLDHYGLHIYYNIPALVGKVGINASARALDAAAEPGVDGRVRQGNLSGGRRSVLAQPAARHPFLPDRGGRGRHHPGLQPGAQLCPGQLIRSSVTRGAP